MHIPTNPSNLLVSWEGVSDAQTTDTYTSSSGFDASWCGRLSHRVCSSCCIQVCRSEWMVESNREFDSNKLQLRWWFMVEEKEKNTSNNLYRLRVPSSLYTLYSHAPHPERFHSSAQPPKSLRAKQTLYTDTNSTRRLRSDRIKFGSERNLIEEERGLD